MICERESLTPVHKFLQNGPTHQLFHRTLDLTLGSIGPVLLGRLSHQKIHLEVVTFFSQLVALVPTNRFVPETKSVRKHLGFAHFLNNNRCLDSGDIDQHDSMTSTSWVELIELVLKLP